MSGHFEFLNEDSYRLTCLRPMKITTFLISYLSETDLKV